MATRGEERYPVENVDYGWRRNDRRRFDTGAGIVGRGRGLDPSGPSPPARPPDDEGRGILYRA